MRAQIINILIGLGLPWTLSCLGGRDIVVGHHAQIQVMAYFQATNVAFFVSIILLVTFLALNLFVAVIMDNFDYLTRSTRLRYLRS